MKSLFSSKTFWVAILQALGGVIAAAHPDPTVKVAGGALIAKSAVDIGLRLLTTEPVTASGGKTAGLSVVVLALCLGTSACTKPDVPQLLQDAQYGLDVDCLIPGAVEQTICVFGDDAVAAAKAAYVKDPTGGAAAVKQILTDAVAKQPTLGPYVNWLASAI